MDAAVGCPTFHMPPAADFMVVDHLDPGRERLAVLDAVLEVDDTPACFRLREGVAVDARARRGGELRLDLIAIEHDLVVAGARGLVFLLERRSVLVVGLVGSSGSDADFSRERHHEHVAIVADAGAAEMGVAEAPDLGVGIVVAAAGVPTGGAGVGTQLHHAEGRGGTGKGVAVEAGADERVDVFEDAIRFRRILCNDE
jgi:hypothetical protein